MAKYDVYSNPDSLGYLLNVQSELMDDLNTRIVVPLLPLKEAPEPAKRLNPIFEIDGTDHMMATQFLASVPVAILAKPNANLSDRFDLINNALDMVFQGF